MNTIQLECFLSVAEHLNFSRASEELKITQPAVSHQIRTLEDELGVRLFRRTSKSVELTTEGLLFLPDADMILKTALSARARLQKKEKVLPFDLGCHSPAELRLLPPVIRSLRQEFPTLLPQVHTIPFDSLFGMVENRQLNAALSLFSGSKKTALAFRELFSCPMACICLPDHPLAGLGTLTADTLKKFDLVTSPPRRLPEEIRQCHLKVLSPSSGQKLYFSDDIESILVLVGAGLGYTLHPDIPAFREPGLCYLPVADFPSLSFGVYYRKDDDHPVTKRFLRLISSPSALSP
jgi:DNA-binding transcriptional LysR family regulator